MYRDRRSRTSSYQSSIPWQRTADAVNGRRAGKILLRAGLLVAAAVLLLGGGIVMVSWRRGEPHSPAKGSGQTASQTNGTGAGATSQPAGFNKQQYSLTDASSLWVVVNKKRPLNPLQYAPAHLVVPDIPLRSNITGDERQVSSVMAPALETMVRAASTEGVHLNLQSGYRSYAFQTNLFNSYVQQSGLAAAEQASARPGHSEHQTGLAADLGGTSQPACNVAACFADTVEGKWLVVNAYKYGFIIRYPADKVAVTGYEYEPWHVRYIGTALSTEMHDQGVETLEEFFGLGAAPSY
ncbi:MAG TPA: M15 family metallopeptidase [Candidatus Saccharimonadales bacterium]|nr:M15 family metallopeptidase [Candidatus Saccharimonadales bacterium]